jgi:predicted permease
MDTLWHDLRYSLRSLATRPGFAVVAVVVLALGIGVNTAIFSLVNALLFRSLPVNAPDQLRFLYLADPSAPNVYAGMGYRDFLDLRDQYADVFSGMLGRSRAVAEIRTQSDTERATGEAVTTNYFDVLGVKPRIGRTFVPGEDDATNVPPVIVISHALWRARFDEDPDILGKHLDLEQRTYTIVGVMPPEFKGTLSSWEASQYWVSLEQRAVNRPCPTPNYRDHMSVAAIGRLNPSVTGAQAQAAFDAKGTRLKPSSLPPGIVREGEPWPMWRLVLLAAQRSSLPFDPGTKIVPERLVIAIMAVAGMLLAIAAANLTGMLMSRGVMRQTEIAMRLTLGAGRWRLARQLFIECALLAAVGGAFGLLLAAGLVRAFQAGVPTRITAYGLSVNAPSVVAFEIPIDWHVLAFAAVSCVATAVLVGLAPALQATRTDLLSALGSGAAGGSKGMRTRLRYWIVVPQVCLSLVLLLVAGVLTRTLLKAEALEPGYDADRLVFVAFQVPSSRCRGDKQSPEDVRAYHDWRAQVLRQILQRASEEVSNASLTSVLPLESPRIMRSWVLGKDPFSTSTQYQWVSRTVVSRGYFQTMRISVSRGRTFSELDYASPPRVVIVSGSLARRLWSDRNPVGQYLAFSQPDSKYAPQWLEVVGVAEEVTSPIMEWNENPIAYTPLDSIGWPTSLVAQVTDSPSALIRTLRRIVVEADPTVQITRSATMRDAIDERLYLRRIAAGILSASGLIGLLLASVGLYGVVSFSVAQRVHEIGVRTALGARRVDIMQLIVREGMRVVLFGGVLGLILGYAGVRLTSRFVVAIPALDVITLIAVPMVLTAVIALACYIPARRAARVDPMIALRQL